MIITEFVSLSPKVYSYEYIGVDGKLVGSRKLKGMSKVVVKKEIKHDDFKDVLYTNKTISKKTTTTFRPFNHQVYTITQDKIALTSMYDKGRLIDQVNILPYGYKDKT